MLNLYLSDKLHFDVDDSISKCLDRKYDSNRGVLKSVYGTYNPLLAFYPSVYKIVEFTQAKVNRDDGAKALNDLQKHSQEFVDNYQSNSILVMQNQDLLPYLDTRGERIVIDPTCTISNENFEYILENLKKILGEGWWKFASILKTITFVKVVNRTNLPYFSGGSTSLWGGMHMVAGSDPFIFAECITHEAAHFWLSLFEESEELIKNAWTDPKWVSPWRHDLRPIGGIFHGIFVFSCVVVTLGQILNSEEDPQMKAKLINRIQELSSQVLSGIETLESSKCLLHQGIELCNQSKVRIESAKKLISAVSETTHL